MKLFKILKRVLSSRLHIHLIVLFIVLIYIVQNY